MSAFYEIYTRWFHPGVPLLVFTVTDYDPPLPANAWAQEDAERLKQAWTHDRDVEVRVSWNVKPWSSRDEFLAAIGDGVGHATPGGPDKNVILLYVSAHGLVNDDGQPVLLLGSPKLSADAEPSLAAALPEQVLVDELLERLKQDRPSKTKLVLFLDAGRIESNWQLGVLYNGFAEALSKAVDTANVSDLLIVSATSPGQVAWSFPEQRCTAFGLEVCQGLAGAADQNRDGHVTVSELRKYLETHVSARVREAYDMDQEPKFFGDLAEHVRLAYVDASRQSEPTRDDVATAEADSVLATLWEAHARCYPWQDPSPATSSVQRRHRLSFEAFQQGLLRLEELWGSGQAYQEKAEELQGALKALAAELVKPPPEQWSDPGAPSLPLAVRLPKPRQEELRKRIREHLPTANQDARPLNLLPSDEVAWAAWDWLLGDQQEVRPGLIDSVLELARPPANPADREQNKSAEVVELRTLRQFRRNGRLPENVSRDGTILKDTLLTRQEAEAVASAGTELLALDSLRLFVDQGDRRRREGQDRLFVDRVDEAKQGLQRANELYQRARKAESEVAHVLATRDRLWMETPYFLQWSAGRHNDADVKTCLELLQAAAALDRETNRRISEWRQAVGGRAEDLMDVVRHQVDTLNEEAKRLNNTLDDLRKGLEKDVEEAILQAENRPTRSKIRDLLRTPLVTGKDREQLRSSYQKLQPSQTTRLGGPPLNTATSQPTAAAPENQLAAAYWLKSPHLSHPAWLLLGERRSLEPSTSEPQTSRDDPSLDRVRAFSHLARDVRKRLSGLLALTGSLGRPGDPSDKPDQVWASREQAARDSQAAVTLLNLAGCASWGKPESLLHDPLGELQRYYEDEFWLWQAQRALDDFYGDDGADDGVPGDKPYFAKVAEWCLRKADRKDAVRLVGLAAAQQLLEHRAKAAPNWLTATAGKVQVRRNSDAFSQKLQLQFSDDLPSGTAALALEDYAPQRVAFRRVQETTPSPPRTVLEQAVPAASSQQEPYLNLTCPLKDADALPNDAQPWTFRAYYRGHVAVAAFPVEVLRPGQVALHERVLYRAPKLEVQGSKDPGMVAIGLDCSWSMEGDRIKNATNGLKDILDELSYNPGYSVSLWLFGHRRYYSQERKGGLYELTWNPHWKKNSRNLAWKEDDPSVRFENDVQEVWRSDDFRTPAQSKGAWKQKNEEVLAFWLNKEETPISACGYTPLHLAMIRATEEHLSQIAKVGARRLIVLSDGRDYVAGDTDPDIQFSPPWKYDPLLGRTPRDVAASLSRANQGAGEPVRVFFVADVSTGELNELSNTIKKGGVSCQVLPTKFQEPDALRKGLRRSLGLYRWNVKDQETGQKINPLELSLNAPFEFSEPQAKGKRCTVELGYGGDKPLHTADMAVEGGEALVLHVVEGDDGPRLVHRRYQRAGDTDYVQHSQTVPGHKPPSGGQDLNDFNPASFFVSAHPPSRLSERSVRFPVSVQNGKAERFSPRPAEIWAEITPGQSADGEEFKSAGHPYIFYDLDYELGQPVPVLQFVASPWPPLANRAALKLWFKLQPQLTPPTKEVRVSSVRGEREDDFAKELRVPDVVQFSVQVRPFQDAEGSGQEVFVTEQRDKSALAAAFKVEVSGTPDTIRRQSYPQVGRVEHEFRYRNASPSDVEQFWLRLTSVEALKKEAVEFQAPKPLVVSE
ncbi:MAG: caspase family protein [Planctomycetota bacterium]|nr:caspase family protein [Planctomycetota bacterium]